MPRFRSCSRRFVHAPLRHAALACGAAGALLALPSTAPAQQANAPFALANSLSLTLDPLFRVEPAEPPEPPASPFLPCACGCGIFEVGGTSMLPHGQGGVAWIEWDYADQNRNWHGTSSAPAADNDDKRLKTHFFQAGVQYMFDDSWGTQVQVPFANRYFRAVDEDTGSVASTDWTSFGDARIKGLYTGFRPDLSLGVDFGVKLPTGDYQHSGADRDTQIGTGSTDLLLGGYYRRPLSADESWKSFFQIEGDFPVLIKDDYRPGVEIDASAGVNYSGFSIGTVSVVPVGQLLISCRSSDGGANSADPVASGYERVLVSPGVEIAFHPFMFYADVEFPIWQNMRGDQLVAPALFKVMLSYTF